MELKTEDFLAITLFYRETENGVSGDPVATVERAEEQIRQVIADWEVRIIDEDRTKQNPLSDCAYLQLLVIVPDWNAVQRSRFEGELSDALAEKDSSARVS